MIDDLLSKSLDLCGIAAIAAVHKIPEVFNTSQTRIDYHDRAGPECPESHEAVLNSIPPTGIKALLPQRSRRWTVLPAATR